MDHIVGFHPNIAALFLRIALGFILADHGYPKLFSREFGPRGFANVLKNLGVPFPEFFAYIVGIVEFFGGIFLILGLATRYIAAIVTINMLIAIFTVQKSSIRQGQSGLSPDASGDHELDFMLLVAAVVLVLTGAGRISLDFLIFA